MRVATTRDEPGFPMTEDRTGFLDRKAFVLIVVGLAGLLIPVASLAGTSWDAWAWCLPFSGLIAGQNVQWCLRMASDATGPGEEHRPQRYLTVLLSAVGAAIGVVVAIGGGSGFLGINVGLVVGGFLGGVCIAGLSVFSQM